MVKFINDDFLGLLYGNRIIQDDNFNSYSLVSVLDDSVYKIYTDSDYKYKLNLEVVKKEFILSELKDIEELVLPDSLLSYNDSIVGFKMPYIKGNTLDNVDDSLPCFLKLVDVIDSFSSLSFPFCIGDLHEKNVIVDDLGDIHIIDCDSFVINNREIYEDDGKMCNGKYVEYGVVFGGVNDFKGHSINTDYYCLFMMVVSKIMEKHGISFDNYLFHGYRCNDWYFNYLMDRASSNINSFVLSKDDVLYMFDNMDRFSFYISDNVSDEELDSVIKRVRDNR